ncbi:hypothetical protein [Rhizobium leguminosarum]|uniref:hypothetical protein n=1 Tax=Rhizobium leguminosarum TaxID=384 RepID=UPI001AA03F6D|nr:hypothetical protein [Rhizobium leguminosarum]
MRPLSFHGGEGTAPHGFPAAGGAAFNAVDAMATFRGSVEAFSDAAHNELASGAGYRIARAKMTKLHRSRKTEIGKMLDAYSRQPWATSEHLAVRKVADQRSGGSSGKEKAAVHAPITVHFHADTGDARSRQAVADDIRRTVLQVVRSR